MVEKGINIYQKVQKIQSEIKELIRTEENKFQKYKFFNELQVLKLLRPLLEKYQLTLLLSDDISQPFIHEKDGKEHFVKYLKKLEIVDCETIQSPLSNKGQQIVDGEIKPDNSLKGQIPENKLFFNFWACGSNVDLAKAKGSSETYAIKYMLSKFFLIPVKDEADPDYQNSDAGNSSQQKGFKSSWK